MVEHKVCKGCQHNHYPECHGTIMDDGKYMNIENLRPSFGCGQKYDSKITDFSIVRKSEIEIRIEELENKIKILEEKTKV